MIRSNIFISTGVVLGLAIVGLYGALRELSFRSNIELLRNHSTPSIDRAKNGMAELNSWKAVRNAAGTPSSATFAAGQLALREALRARGEEKPVQQQELLCQSLDLIVRASLEEPASAKMQIALADLQVLIPEPLPFCGEKLSASSRTVLSSATYTPTQRLHRVNAMAPWSANELYFSALVHLRIGEREEGFRLLRKDEEHNPFFSDAERQYVAGIIRSPAELELAVPRRYPEVIRWMQIFAHTRPNEARKWEGVFRGALNDAVVELSTRFVDTQKNRTEFAQYLNHINSQPLSQLDDSVRQKIDALRAQIALQQEDPPLAQFYEARALLTRIPVAKSHSADDRLPTKTPLPAWTSDSSTTRGWLNGAGTAIGAYVPDHFSPRLLVISGEPESFELRGSEIEIYGSDDNLVFQKVAFDAPQIMHTEQASLMAIPLKSFGFRILKLRTQTGSAALLAAAPMRELLQIYGENVR